MEPVISQHLSDETSHECVQRGERTIVRHARFSTDARSFEERMVQNGAQSRSWPASPDREPTLANGYYAKVHACHKDEGKRCQHLWKEEQIAHTRKQAQNRVDKS